ncbi:MAG TPA: chemotaxis protein CheB [Candidatus Eremiobacteraceae bacterium]|nr:chemotaxis protein CheB [Candidatus Eremiobacteraceae bacterium]
MTKTRWARVLIVEDSPVAGRILSEGIAQDNRLAVVGIATTVRDAIEMFNRLQPDVITLDLMLPDESGLRVIQRVRHVRQTPIIVISTLGTAGTESLPFLALAAGAADVIVKPAGDENELRAFFPDLNQRIATLALAHAVPTHESPLRISTNGTAPRPQPIETNGALECVVVGASTGGPLALVDLLTGLGPDFAAPVIIVQHIAAPFVEGLVRWLDKETPMRVALAEDGILPARGRAYVAPSGADLVFGPGGRLRVKAVSAEKRATSPSADALFASASDTYKSRCAGVLLTGMGRDGAEGLLKLRTKGAKTFAQDERSSTVFGMPAAAGRLGAVEAFAEPRVIAGRLRKLAARHERIT